MPNLKEDIKQSAAWTVSAFEALGKKMDYSIESLKHIDALIEEYTENGKPKPNGLLSDGLGAKLFSFGSYIGEAIIKNIDGAKWITDDKDPNGEMNIQIKLSSGSVVWPVQKMIKRLKNGADESIYAYVKILSGESASEEKSKPSNKKSSWKFWQK